MLRVNDWIVSYQGSIQRVSSLSTVLEILTSIGKDFKDLKFYFTGGHIIVNCD